MRSCSTGTWSCVIRLESRIKVGKLLPHSVAIVGFSVLAKVEYIYSKRWPYCKKQHRWSRHRHVCCSWSGRFVDKCCILDRARIRIARRLLQCRVRCFQRCIRTLISWCQSQRVRQRERIMRLEAEEAQVHRHGRNAQESAGWNAYVLVSFLVHSYLETV